MKKSMMTGLLASGLLSCSLALAQGSDGGKFMRFFDTNNDGIVTLDEFEAASKARFERMDSDHNGAITQQEFRDYIKQRRAEHKQAKLTEMDSNGDGQVSKDEFVVYQTRKAENRFAYLDKNQDGHLTFEEYDNGHHRGHHGGKHLFHKLDKNDDGGITHEESHAAWSAWFSRIDRNGDKVVTSEEVKTYREQKQQR